MNGGTVTLCYVYSQEIKAIILTTHLFYMAMQTPIYDQN